MAFTSIVIVIVVIYVFGYAGMIVYDLFLKKEPVEFMPKPKDVDIDISDEAGQFKPIAVGNTEPQKHVATQSSATDKSHPLSSQQHKHLLHLHSQLHHSRWIVISPKKSHLTT